MSLGAVNFDNILNPLEAWNEFRKYLVSLYIESYGEEYQELIEKRISDTYYMFDSDPVDTYNFFKKNNISLGIKFINRIEREYRNYISVKDKIDKTISDKYKNYLGSFYNVIPKFIPDEFMEVDFEAYSFENINRLHDKYISEEHRNDILSRQSKYIDFCLYYGIKPITDPNVIEEMIKMRRKLEKLEYRLLIDDTIWGKRIKKELYEKTGCNVNSDLLSTFIFSDKSSASVNMITNNDGKKIRICYFPVMRNYGNCCLDKMFFHENRHVVESGYDASGFVSIYTGLYYLINELRTQENAISDSNEFKRIPLFSTKPDSINTVNVYERLFEFCGPFIKNYLYLLNDIGINNAWYELEYLFGKDNLMALEEYLSSANSSLLCGFNNKIDYNKQYFLTYQLDRHYLSMQ